MTAPPPATANGQTRARLGHVVEEPVRRTLLRDFYVPRAGYARVAALADWAGDPEIGRSLAYRFGNRIVQANNDMLGSLTGLPAQFRDNWSMLSDPRQRNLLAHSLVDEALLTPRRRKAVFSMMLWGSLFIWMMVGLVVFVVNREALATYESVYSLFFYSLATSIFLPTPFEILLGNAVENLGVVWTVAIASLAKTAGSWIVLLMGDKANEGLSTLLERRPLLRRMFKALERFAQRFGYFAVFVLFAIPLMSDTAPLFILAVLKMRKSAFLAVMCLAIIVRSLLYIYLGDFFTGLF